MIVAGHESDCGACETRIFEGETIGMVAGEWCCEECVKDLGEDEWDAGQDTRAWEAGRWDA